MRSLSASVAAAVLLLAGCRGGPREAQAVVLVTLDTTRADHIGCYGGRQVETPAIDALARDGALFREAITVAPITLVSHASILTGRYPVAHGVRNNGMFVLPDSERTLAEVFKAHGYDTGAFVGGYPLSTAYGLTQGFDVYDDNFPSARQDAAGPDMPERSAAEVNEAAFHWISKRKGKRFFLWIHYYDPHADYNPPSPYKERYAGRLYDGEIAFADANLAKLLSRLAEVADPRRTVVALVGDHGESLGDHGELFHGVLVYEPVLRVPLVLKAPGLLPAGTQITETVSSVDLFPTLLHLAGLAGESGKGPKLHGVDLVPLAAGQAKKAREAPATDDQVPILSESLLSNFEFGWSPLYSIRSGPWKYVEAPQPELYDLDADPDEERNLLAGGGPARDAPAPDAADATVVLERTRKMKESLDGALSRLGADAAPAGASHHEMSEEEIEKLQALGYVQGPAARAKGPAAAKRPSPAGVGNASTKDPKDLIELYQAIVDLGVVFRRGDFVKVVDTCKSLLAVEPDNGRLQWWLGEALRATKSYEELDKFAGPLLSSDDSSHFWVPGLLAKAREDQGDNEGAIALYRIALKKDPDYAGNAIRLAKALYELGRYPESLDQAHKILEKNPRHLPSLQLAADDERHLGHVDAAVQLWKKSLEVAPDDPFALESLGHLLFASQKFDDSKPLFERLAKKAPDNPEGPKFLGALAVLRHDYAEALGLLRKADELKRGDTVTDYWLGLALINTGDLSGAEARILPIIDKHPRSAEGHRALGLLRKAQGRKQDAITSFQQAVSLNPDDGLSRRSLQELAGGGK